MLVKIQLLVKEGSLALVERSVFEVNQVEQLYDQNDQACVSQVLLLVLVLALSAHTPVQHAFQVDQHLLDFIAFLIQLVLSGHGSLSIVPELVDGILLVLVHNHSPKVDKGVEVS